MGTNRAEYWNIAEICVLGKLFKMKKIGIEIPKNFLSLWKDANPGIAEIEDVRERLVGLKR